jgi:cell division protein FtsB
MNENSSELELREQVETLTRENERLKREIARLKGQLVPKEHGGAMSSKLKDALRE